MITKTQEAVQAFKVGDRKTALKLASGFRLGLTPDERAKLKRGYECLLYPDFYLQLGREVDRDVDVALTLFREKFVTEADHEVVNG